MMYALNVAWGIAFTFTYSFQCSPVEGFWTHVQGKRIGRVDISVNYYYAVSTIIIDVMVLTLPWPMVWGLRMKRTQKVAVISIFMLGAMCVPPIPTPSTFYLLSFITTDSPYRVTAMSIGKCHTFFTIGEVLKKTHTKPVCRPSPFHHKPKHLPHKRTAKHPSSTGPSPNVVSQ